MWDEVLTVPLQEHSIVVTVVFLQLKLVHRDVEFLLIDLAGNHLVHRLRGEGLKPLLLQRVSLEDGVMGEFGSSSDYFLEIPETRFHSPGELSELLFHGLKEAGGESLLLGFIAIMGNKFSCNE